MIDTPVKRAASLTFALINSGIRVPSGVSTQAERGYTLGLYTPIFVGLNAPGIYYYQLLVS